MKVLVKEAGVERFVAQSYGGLTYARAGGPVKTEDDPLDESLPDGVQETVEAIKHLEAAVLDAGGIVLRHGSFYGAAIDPMLDAVRGRKVPIVGDGNGVWSLIHVAAAAATVLALERGESGVYNVADDEPAPAREVIPAMADALGAPPPRKVPAWLAKLFAGEIGVRLVLFEPPPRISKKISATCRSRSDRREASAATAAAPTRAERPRHMRDANRAAGIESPAWTRPRSTGCSPSSGGTTASGRPSTTTGGSAAPATPSTPRPQPAGSPTCGSSKRRSRRSGRAATSSSSPPGQGSGPGTSSGTRSA